MATSGVNPRVVRTELDRIASVLWQEQMTPDQASVRDSLIFNQIPIDRGQQQEEVFAGSGYWDQRNEQQNVAEGESRTSNKVTVTVNNFAKQEPISKNYFDDAQFELPMRIVTRMMINGRRTQELRGFETFRGGFTGAVTTSDGVALFSNSHTLISSASTVDNLETDKLTDGVLNTLIRKMHEMPAQDGVVQGFDPTCLLVTPLNYKLASELLDSEWSAQTANNAINVYNSKYGIVPKWSKFLGAAVSTGAGITAGSNDYVALLGRMHEVNRYIRQDLVKDVVDYKFQNNNNYIFKAEYREAYAAVDFLGVQGTSGATGTYA